MVDAGGMYLAGAPNGWTGSAMSDNGDGSWSLTLSLEMGSYEFKFQNGEGGYEELNCGGNRTVTVDGSGPVSYTGCFAQCGETTECAVDPDPANITFRLDMSAEDSISTDGVFLTGSFTSPVWQAGAIAMDDADGDLIYEATVLISGPAGIAYKFFNGNPYPDNVSTEEGGKRLILQPLDVVSTTVWEASIARTTGAVPMRLWTWCVSTAAAPVAPRELRSPSPWT